MEELLHYVDGIDLSRYMDSMTGLIQKDITALKEINEECIKTR